MVESRTSLSLLKMFFLQSLLNVRYMTFRISQVYGIKKSALDKEQDASISFSNSHLLHKLMYNESGGIKDKFRSTCDAI